MAARYWATTINGGATGAMDNLDPDDMDGSATSLVVGDTCQVIDNTNGIKAEYIAQSTASMSESYPDQIIPDLNAGNWWWKLITIRYNYEDGVNAAIGYANTPGAF